MEFHDQSGSAENRCKPRKQIRFKTPVLQSDLWDYSDAYIVIKGTISVTDPNNYAYDQKLAFKNSSKFIGCITKINNTLIDNAVDLDIAMPMYNLTEYSENYSKTSRSFWDYYRDEPDSGLDCDDWL